MTKRTLLPLLMLGFISLMFAQAADLFISEYVEGSSNNKAIEIYNGTGAAVDLANYTMKLASNGSATWSTTNSVTLSGTLANNDVFVIANSAANATILGVADMTHTVTYFNGNDCLGLFHGDTLVDIIGVLGTDPGTAWPVAGTDGATLNHTLIRKPDVAEGNTDWIAGAGTNMDNSEWIVHPIDYIEDLGAHTFDPGGSENAATPTFDPPAGVYGQAISVSISSATAGATIRYTTDGSTPTETSTQYTNPIPLSTNTTLKAIAFATGFDPSYVATASYIFPEVVQNMTQLRNATAGDGTVYMVAGEVMLTFQQSFRHQKYVQDFEAGILIDDTAGVITTTYNLMDGITGLTGTIAFYNNMLQFTPVADPGPASSTNNYISPPVVTIAQINANVASYQARLVKIANAHFVETGTFATGQNYTLEDGTGSVVFRTTFYDVDYIGEAIPTGNFNIWVLVNQYNQTPQVTARALSDWSGVANDDNIATPTQLLGNYPNPFNPSTTISFSTAKADPVQITIYNHRGQAVKTWNLETKAAGNHSVQWDGRDNNGLAVSSGVYFYRMFSGTYSSTRKMVLMK
ncbi:MAG: chitobiase/beta-hexosaminidase C-terminal domain-containing protein [Candidatus Cloacimonetes bacterium]|nr:chitobiase/beta-hexosaminidase C-terminal domain-containing protein [Candidatus Cloacimonadota bacterium]MDD3142842.1 chitobiase/beta-hexosaminidase C-terminal domain-containing protein [Candidatus Cloacimonadota bacterium]MDY0366244.1 chitobiase/beta-hexosaminidase C-terminal domain-containing protein [Candidatus Syntrophosphaera sp.]